MPEATAAEASGSTRAARSLLGTDMLLCRSEVSKTAKLQVTMKSRAARSAGWTMATLVAGTPHSTDEELDLFENLLASISGDILDELLTTINQADFMTDRPGFKLANLLFNPAASGSDEHWQRLKQRAHEMELRVLHEALARGLLQYGELGACARPWSRRCHAWVVTDGLHSCPSPPVPPLALARMARPARAS